MNRTKKVFKGHGWDRALLLPIVGLTSLLGVALASAPHNAQAGSTWGGNGGNSVHSLGTTWGGNGGN